MSSTSRAVLGWISTIGVFVVVLSYILVTATAPTLITATQLGNDLSSFSGQPPLGAFFIYARLPVIAVSINLLAITYFCILVFGACFVAAFRSRGGFLLSLKRLTKVGRITSSSNWLVAMPLVSRIQNHYTLGTRNPTEGIVEETRDKTRTVEIEVPFLSRSLFTVPGTCKGKDRISHFHFKRMAWSALARMDLHRGFVDFVRPCSRGARRGDKLGAGKSCHGGHLRHCSCDCLRCLRGICGGTLALVL